MILDEFVATYGYNRSYAATCLRNRTRKVLDTTGGDTRVYVASSTMTRRKTGGRPCVYGEPIKTAIVWIWALFGYQCGKRLVHIIQHQFDVLTAYKPVSRLSPKDRMLLKNISAATVDRVLKPYRQALPLRGRGYTRPARGSLINSIPIRTFGEWKNVTPGHFQIDCVGHDGGVIGGQCCFTLTASRCVFGLV